MPGEDPCSQRDSRDHHHSYSAHDALSQARPATSLLSDRAPLMMRRVHDLWLVMGCVRDLRLVMGAMHNLRLLVRSMRNLWLLVGRVRLLLPGWSLG